MKKLFLCVCLIIMGHTIFFAAEKWQEVGGPLNMTGQGPSEAGFSVAINGDGTIIAVGEPSWNGESGRVRAYRLNGTGTSSSRYFWQELGNPSDMIGQNYGDKAGSSVAINHNGTVIAVGEPGWNESAGRVRAYQFNGSSWQELGDPSDMIGGYIGDDTGWSVAINHDGTAIAVGEPGVNNASGRVRVFELINGYWNVITDFIILGETSGDQTGWSVALNYDGSLIVVGEPGWNGLGFSGQGRVLVYELIQFSLNLIGSPLYGQNMGDRAGASVTLNYGSYNNPVVAFGEPFWNRQSGRVRAYQFDGSSWQEIGGPFDMTGTNSNDQVGFSVSINQGLEGDIIIAVGEPYWNSSGRVRIYYSAGNSSSWQELGGPFDMTGSIGDQVGYSVAITSDGDMVAVGEPYWNSDGRVRAYMLVPIVSQLPQSTQHLQHTASEISGQTLPGTAKEHHVNSMSFLAAVYPNSYHSPYTFKTLQQ